ncbi:MAG: MBOAT family protein [Clostridiales bacterium]|nr:MBOAT family protein [Clostridiales bacterium]
MRFNSYISLAYLGIFLPIVLIAYGILPKKIRPFVLLGASLALFWFMSEFLVAYFILSTILIYLSALWLDKLKAKQKALSALAESKEEKKAIKKASKNKQLAVVVVCILINIGILAVLKYSPFFLNNLNLIFSLAKSDISIDIPKFLAPIGISFYTLQAVSYIHDVYKEKIEADRNLGRVALFMCFFPIIMEGPICRYSDTAQKLWSGESLKYRNVTFGIQKILFGMMKKMVIADRLNLIVTNIFKNHEALNLDGGIVALGALLYTIELYAEFSGTIDVVIGSGEMFGISIPENFRQPFFAKSISEFWQRWHITLGTWFKDYIFYPVTMSENLKKLTKKARQKLGRHYGPMPATIIAFFCVWFCNGLWHGAGWQYIMFGMYHFVLISIGSLVLPLSNNVLGKLKIDRNKLPYKIFTIVRTFLFVCIGELIFNSSGFYDSISLLKILFTDFSLKTLFNGSIFNLGIDHYDLLILAVTLVIVFIVSFSKEKGKNVREEIAAKPIFVRWPIYIGLIVFIVVFGAYGGSYAPIDPIYANF